ncbi:hypothetical protein [Streptomyces sp. NPDC047315]|uniref:hypothetical protein n=1 Tax=Streptomyces sp. NPDC047315 TaxID=3155142 RepID=UPI00340F0222
MTGPDHYREAEAHLASASRNALRGDDPGHALAAAQVHATLALAAATALIDEKPRSGSFDAYREWEAVATAVEEAPGA